MSVEIYGPQGYDFQYLNSLLIALEYLDKDEVEVYIEKSNEEDAQIVFKEKNIKYIIDIQVKNKSDDIDIETFAKWISHFESRSETVCLLNKIQQDNRFALFISDARSKDDVSLFVDDNAINIELDRRFSNEYLNSIKEYIKKCCDNKSDISISRNNYLNKLMDTITNSNLRKILKKIKLREKYTEKYSNEAIKSLLNKKFYIPQSNLDNVVIELLDKIRKGRGTNTSISRELLEVINKYSGKIILNRDENYISRSERELCKQILDSRNILLLTGVSLCGKSYLAKDIAQEYLEDGYNIEQTGEIYGDSGGLSFIKSRSLEDRLLILEDPFGQVETKTDAGSILSEIRKIIRESKTNRKIIITSRKDILLDVYLKRNIEECTIDSHNWIDLTNKEHENIKCLWEQYYGNSRESLMIYDKIIKRIRDVEKSHSLQLGHIANIYNSNKNLDKLSSLNTTNILNTARVDSEDLANIIDRRGEISRYIFITLGLCCNTYRQINLDDLLFILSNAKECPGIIEDKYITGAKHYSLGKVENESKFYLKYDDEYRLLDEYKNELRYLQNYGYIEIDNLKRIAFVHPIYHYAAQLLFKKYYNDIFEKERIIEIMDRCISSISVNANLSMLTILENYYREEDDNTIKKIMLKALNSVFPSVRDKVVMFFDRRINKLNENEQKKFTDVLISSNNIQNIHINWYKGIPYFKKTNYFDFSLVGESEYRLNDKDIEPIIDNINDNINISSEDMWTLININNSKHLSFEVLEKAMNYDESFIRAKAIELIFNKYAFEFSKDKIEGYLNEYEHHNVIYSLFKGAMDSWLKYNEESRMLIIDYFKKSLDRMSVSIRVKRFLENFGDEYSYTGIDWIDLEYNQKEILWNVWHEIFIEFFNKFPSKYTRIHQAHMVNTTNKSLKFIKNEEKIVELSTAWFSWLHRDLEHNLPDDYGMSVAEYLMKGTSVKSSFRQSIFEQMLLTQNTSFITTNVYIFIEYWDKLSDSEKQVLLNIYKSKRNDIKWIKSVSLNVEDIPKDIQVEILGQTIDDKNTSDIVDILIQQDLLEPCLNIYCGYPQPLWWNGLHHTNKKLWDDIIVEVLKRDKFDNSYNIALRELMDLLYNHDDRRIENIYEIYEEILLKDYKKRSLVFEKLIHVTATQNQSNKKLWDLLFEYSSQEEECFYYDRITEDIELIQYYQYGNGDLFELFDEEKIFKQIYPRLDSDNEIIKFINRFLSTYSSIISINEFANKDLELEKETFKNMLIDKLRKTPPRLFISNYIIQNSVKKLNIKSSELENLIEKNRVRLLDIASECRKKYNDNYDLDNWN